MMKGDPGYFGPHSMMWKINKEITVLFGGARALLMHAAHPLIAAGARQTSFYQRDPWKRLIRTLSLQNSVTFGTKKEADESAHRINKLHEVIKGKDPISQGTYDALDHEQLLWVHARYLLPISLAIRTLVPMDKITKIGTNSKVLVPRPEICSIVTLKPNRATPKRSIFLLENSIPGAHLSSVERKLKAIPISSANSITGAL